MLDKNIDKDIEILKKVQGIFEHLKTHGWINDIKRDVDTDTVILSIENVLSELEKWRKIKQELIKVNKRIYDVEAIEELIEEICNKDKELETYKKIAEHLAYAIEYNLQDDIITDILCDFTRNDKLCSEKCINCIIDWAKSEVLKNE